MYRTIASLLLFGALSFVAPRLVEATPYQFAQFSSPNGGKPFTFTNNGGASADIGAVNVPVTFNFTAATGLSTADRAAFLNISPVTISSNQPAVAAGPLVDQPINLTDRLTLTSGMNGTGTNFLTMIFTGDITGFLGGPGGSLLGADNNASNPRVVTYTSDFGTFVPPGNSYNLALQDITPALSIGAGGFLNSSVANVTGQFSANFVVVPEPSSIVLCGLGIIAVVGRTAGRKRLAKART